MEGHDFSLVYVWCRSKKYAISIVALSPRNASGDHGTLRRSRVSDVTNVIFFTLTVYRHSERQTVVYTATADQQICENDCSPALAPVRTPRAGRMQKSYVNNLCDVQQAYAPLNVLASSQNLICGGGGWRVAWKFALPHNVSDDSSLLFWDLPF